LSLSTEKETDRGNEMRECFSPFFSPYSIFETV
jgi:hypothetical protein